MSLYNDLTSVLTPYANKIKQNESDIGDIQDALEHLDVETDKTLSVDGKPADAKATGNAIDKVKADLNYVVKHDITQIVNQERFILGSSITPTLTYNNDGFTSVLPSSANCMYGFSFDTKAGKTYSVDVIVSAGTILGLYAVNGTSPSVTNYLDKIEDVSSGNTGTLSFTAISNTTTIWIYQAYNVNTITVSSISIDNYLCYNNMDDTLTSTKAPAPAKTVGDRLRTIPDNEWLGYNNLFQITDSDLITDVVPSAGSVTRTINGNNISFVTARVNTLSAYLLRGLEIGTYYTMSFYCETDLTSTNPTAKITINAISNHIGSPYAVFEKNGNKYTCVFKAVDYTQCFAVMTSYDSGEIIFSDITIRKTHMLYNAYCDFDGIDISAFNKCLCIGDSLTYGGFNANNVDPDVGIAELAAKYSYPAYLQKLTGIITEKVATGGLTSVSWWETYGNNDLSGYDMAIIQLGVNDGSPAFYGGWTQASITAFTNIINKLKNENAGIKIYVATTVPAPSYMDAGRESVCTGIRELVENLNDENVVLADIHQYGHTNDSIGYAAGHLTAYGYNRLARDYIALISYHMHTHPNLYRFIQFIGTEYTYNN